MPPPGHALFVLNHAFTAYERAKAQWRRKVGLNTHERQAISHLWHSGGLTIGDLGERLALSRAAMTTLVDRLEQGGFAVRARDPIDRRKTVIRASTDGLREWDTLAGPLTDELEEYIRTLEPEAWHTVVGFLDRVYEASTADAERHSTGAYDAAPAVDAPAREEPA